MKRFVFFTLICISIHAIAQQKYTSNSKSAIKLYEEGVEYLRKRKYDEAEAIFFKVLDKDSEFVEAMLMLGEVYLEQGNTELAIQYYSNAMEKNPLFYPPGYIVIGNLSLKSGKYQKAKEAYSKYLESNKTTEKLKKEAHENLKRCEFGIQAVSHPVPYQPINLGDSINTEYDEYWPSLSADEQILVFTRLVPKNLNDNSRFRNRQEDFYITRKTDDHWSKALPIGEPLNSPDNEGAQTISANGKWMFFTACNRPDGEGLCDIYFSFHKDDEWSTPVNLGPPINTSNKETQPSVSADGRILFFASDRPGGFGGLDIWSSQLTESNTWAEPVNLGPKINTIGDDMSPFIHFDNQTLYFSSDKQLGLGGYDIFVTHIDSSGIWSAPKNLGYPINTHQDEMGIIINAFGNHAFFSSDRDQPGNRDLFEFELYPEARPLPVSYMKGKVYDALTFERLKATLELIDIESGKIVMKSQSDKTSGEFLICIPANAEYILNVNKEGYLFYSENYKIEGMHGSLDPFLADIPLKPIKPGQSIVLRNVFYDTDSYKLKPESKIELDRVVSLLTKNPSVAIEISGHTDNVGTPAYNQSLSEKRAAEVVKYINGKGIDSSRLIHKGYGETKPVASNEQESGRKLNRRTELKILSVNK